MNALRDIHCGHFDILERHLSSEWREFLLSGASSADFAHNFLYSDESPLTLLNGVEVSARQARLDKVQREVSSYWHQNASEYMDSLQSMKVQKVYMSFQPSGDDKIVRSLPLYTDCIAFDCPYDSEKSRITTMPDVRNACFLALVDFLNQLQLRPLFESEGSATIAVMLPIDLGAGHFSRSALEVADSLSFSYMADLLGQPEIAINRRLLSERFRSIKALASAVSNSALVAGFRIGSESIESALQGMAIASQAPGSMNPKLFHKLRTQFPSSVVDVIAVQQQIFVQLFGLLARQERAWSHRLSQHVDSQLWPMLRWLMARQGNAQNIAFSTDGSAEASVVASAFENDKLDLFSAVSIDDVVRLRKQDFVSEFRDALRLSEVELCGSSVEEYPNVRRGVEERMASIVEEHKRKVSELKKATSRKTGATVASLIAGAGLSAAGVFNPALGLVSAAIGLIAGPASLSNLFQGIKHGREATKALRRRPIGILLELATSRENA